MGGILDEGGSGPEFWGRQGALLFYVEPDDDDDIQRRRERQRERRGRGAKAWNCGRKSEVARSARGFDLFLFEEGGGIAGGWEMQREWSGGYVFEFKKFE
jgi:hypothetical protein